MRQSTFQRKKGLFSEKGEAIQWMRGLVKISTGKVVQCRGPSHSVNRQTLKTEKLLSSSPSRKSALIWGMQNTTCKYIWEAPEWPWLEHICNSMISPFTDQQLTYGVVREGVIAENFRQISAKFPQTFRRISAPFPGAIKLISLQISANFPQNFCKLSAKTSSLTTP